jgi:hypothetical protein
VVLADKPTIADDTFTLAPALLDEMMSQARAKTGVADRGMVNLIKPRCSREAAAVYAGRGGSTAMKKTIPAVRSFRRRRAAVVGRRP